VDLIVYGLVNDAFRGRYDAYCGQILLYWLFAPFLLIYSLFEYAVIIIVVAVVVAVVVVVVVVLFFELGSSLRSSSNWLEKAENCVIAVGMSQNLGRWMNTPVLGIKCTTFVFEHCYVCLFCLFFCQRVLIVLRCDERYEEPRNSIGINHGSQARDLQDMSSDMDFREG
jgi:hypothetical protein